MPQDPRIPDNPMVKEAVRRWYQSLSAHDLADVGGHLQGLGIVIVLLAQLTPRTKSALSEDDYTRNLENWKRALSKLLSADMGGAS